MSKQATAYVASASAYDVLYDIVNALDDHVMVDGSYETNIPDRTSNRVRVTLTDGNGLSRSFTVRVDENGTS